MFCFLFYSEPGPLRSQLQWLQGWTRSRWHHMTPGSELLWQLSRLISHTCQTGVCVSDASAHRGWWWRTGWMEKAEQSFKVHNLPLLLFCSFSAVNLLDTTTITGDWGWLTYPSHGVRTKIHDELITEHFHNSFKQTEVLMPNDEDYRGWIYLESASSKHLHVFWAGNPYWTVSLWTTNCTNFHHKTTTVSKVVLFFISSEGMWSSDFPTSLL